MIKTNIFDYLAATAKRLPDKLALSDGKNVVTFEQWLDFAERIGSAIIESAGVVMRRPILVFVDRRIETLVGFMGAIASGNFYVPIDCKMPAERIAHMIDVLNPIAALTLSDADDLLLDGAGCKCQRFRISEAWSHELDRAGLETVRRELIDLDPVYCIFTSGSTGVPKGVLIPHRGMMDFGCWILERFGLNDSDVIGNQAPFYFDCSVKDICICIMAGATMHIIPKKCFAFPKLLGQFLNEKSITSLWWATSAVILAANSGVLKSNPPKHVRIVTFGGEAIPAKQLMQWREAVPNATFVNVYGPTETSVDTTYYVVDRDFADDEIVPIGMHCENKCVLVLNEYDKPVAVNEPGELCMRGSGRALGYYNNKAKTEEVFVQNPLHDLYEDKIYRTGDIVKYNEHGELLFVSRKDFQIKHMGNRIELGEIETAVNSVPGVAAAACIYDKPGEKIVCYYETADGDDLDVVNLVKDKIPKYMFPNVCLRLPKMPYNANGKIDRQELKRMYEICQCRQGGIE